MKGRKEEREEEKDGQEKGWTEEKREGEKKKRVRKQQLKPKTIFLHISFRKCSIFSN